MSSESLRSFFDGKVLFVTGATGFLGRLMLAKLMRMGNLKKVLVLSREKKGKSNEERIDKILSGLLFQEMNKFDPKFKEKLRIINGDLEVENLGISHEDREYIKENVEIIIHGAATIKFDEFLRKAISINVRGTKYLLDLALEVKNLINFVHISTAFSNAPRHEIFEDFYKPPIDYKFAFNLINNYDDEFVNTLTPKLINPWPNTYTFTKAIAEGMIKEYKLRMPITVIRPSLVQGTLSDPIPGYTDTIVGFLAFGLGLMTGALRVILVEYPDNSLNYVPADCAINSVLAVCYPKLTAGIDSNVFNCVCESDVLISFEKARMIGYHAHSLYPCKNNIWFPRVHFAKSPFVYRLLFFFYHFIPACLADIILYFKGSKINAKEICGKAYSFLGLYRYFMTHDWNFHAENMNKVYSRMSREDAEYFPTKILNREVGTKYGVEQYNGIRKYVLKESDEDLVAARRKYKLMRVAYYVFWGTVYFFVARFLFRKISEFVGGFIDEITEE